MNNLKEIITKRFFDVFNSANRNYTDGLNPNDVLIKFDLKGLSAGACKIHKMNKYPFKYKYILRFNLQAAQSDINDFLNDTIPHEVAHLLTFYRFGINTKPHGKLWKQICISLGGTGNRCASTNITIDKIYDKRVKCPNCNKIIPVSTRRYNKAKKIYEEDLPPKYIHSSCGELVRFIPL